MEYNWTPRNKSAHPHNWSLTKKSKSYSVKKKSSSTNGAVLTGGLHVEECKLIYHLHKTQVEVHQRPQYKTDTLTQ